MDDEFESINSSLHNLNLSLERLGFNGAMAKGGPGAVEGLTMAVNEAGEKSSDAIHAVAYALKTGRDV